MSVDAQFSMTRVLQPFRGFEEVYQGRSGAYPIAFPGGLAPEAERQIPGYNIRLQAGWPVPLGSRIVLWIPYCRGAQLEFQGLGYRYSVVWRMRSPASLGLRFPPRPPYLYHNSKPGLGARNTGAPGDPRFYPIPAAFKSIEFEQAQPATNDLEAVGNIFVETYDLINDPGIGVPPVPLFSPIGPDGVTTTMQQGIWDPALKYQADNVTFFPLQLDAEGDELIILAHKIPDDEGNYSNWDFTGEDLPFSLTYGDGNDTYPDPTEDSGIYILTGSNP